MPLQQNPGNTSKLSWCHFLQCSFAYLSLEWDVIEIWRFLEVTWRAYPEIHKFCILAPYCLTWIGEDNLFCATYSTILNILRIGSSSISNAIGSYLQNPDNQVSYGGKILTDIFVKLYASTIMFITELAIQMLRMFILCACPPHASEILPLVNPLYKLSKVHQMLLWWMKEFAHSIQISDNDRKVVHCSQGIHCHWTSLIAWFLLMMSYLNMLFIGQLKAEQTS